MSQMTEFEREVATICVDRFLANPALSEAFLDLADRMVPPGYEAFAHPCLSLTYALAWSLDMTSATSRREPSTERWIEQVESCAELVMGRYETRTLPSDFLTPGFKIPWLEVQP